MKPDRFLQAILAAIFLLVLLSLGLYLIRRNAAPALPPDTTPEGVVANFADAVQRGDAERAYRYLAAGQDKPDLIRFRQSLQNNENGLAAASLAVGESSITGERATVSVTILRSNGPFASLQREANVAELVRVDGAWKITSMPYPYWDFGWYSPNKP